MAVFCAPLRILYGIHCIAFNTQVWIINPVYIDLLHAWLSTGTLEGGYFPRPHRLAYVGHTLTPYSALFAQRGGSVRFPVSEAHLGAAILIRTILIQTHRAPRNLCFSLHHCCVLQTNYVSVIMHVYNSATRLRDRLNKYTLGTNLIHIYQILWKLYFTCLWWGCSIFFKRTE